PQAALDPALLTYVRQEFSGPVSAIIGYIDILEEDVPANGLDHLAPDIARLRRAAVSLQQLVKQIMDSNGGLSLELSKLRHDLRTPLNAIKGYAEMLIEEEPPEAFAQDLRNLLNESSRLLIRIEGLTETTGNASATASESTSADVIASSPALSMIAKSAPDDAAA